MITIAKKAAPVLNTILALGGLALVSGCATGGRDSAPPSLVAAPQLAGPSVTIYEASMSAPGFVVIHATDDEGKPLVPGSIGVTAIPGGQSHDVTVALTEPVSPGDRLIAMLYFDSGQPGVYEFGTTSIAEDKPVMYDGKPVATVIDLE
ncbi:MAG TPA: hypothetical protein VLE23_15955 [Geminicoccaceae bacterium]|nr:hypothetical protein [Geminicoccaceae bacterium]